MMGSGHSVSGCRVGCAKCSTWNTIYKYICIITYIQYQISGFLLSGLERISCALRMEVSARNGRKMPSRIYTLRRRDEGGAGSGEGEKFRLCGDGPEIV